MDRATYCHPNTWRAFEFELGLEYRSTADDHVLVRAVEKLWHYPRLTGPWPTREAYGNSVHITPDMLPRDGMLRAFAALEPPRPGQHAASVRLRVGVSDDRIYERLTDVVLTTGQQGWVDVRTDLSAYAGRKWSLFYHPERVTWRVVLAADAIDGVPTTAVWGSPEIVTDREGAKEYTARRQRFR